MNDRFLSSILDYSNDLVESNGLPVAVFDFTIRDFVSRAPCRFCQSCDHFKNQKCDYVIAHSYGCYEAERWNGVYVYYCPISLVFVSTVVFSEKNAAYALVTGPIVMGMLEDSISDSKGVLAESILRLSRKTTEEVNSISRIQRTVSTYLSERNGDSTDDYVYVQNQLHNTLYEITESIRNGENTSYPVELEKRLQKMIINGDKNGAQELINQLLGVLYFNSVGNLQQIKERAKELVIVFSRASIEGGADAQQIFLQNRDYLSEIGRFTTLEELSMYLGSIFHRFVSYAFDFGHFKHTDVMHKAMSYIRDRYSEKISLEKVAEYVGLSRSYLSMIFKDELGVTFTDFVNKVRVEKSEVLLLDPKFDLSEIAVLVGYSDQSYFTKVFTRIKKVSPGQYRRSRGRLDSRKI